MPEHLKRSIHGYVRVEERANGERKWIAACVTHHGPRTRTLLGPAAASLRRPSASTPAKAACRASGSASTNASTDPASSAP